jgi:rRNA maturation protein Nop10
MTRAGKVHTYTLREHVLPVHCGAHLNRKCPPYTLEIKPCGMGNASSDVIHTQHEAYLAFS